MNFSAQPAKAPTAFAQRVYGVVAGIPRGRVATYQAIAEAIGCRSARAVGSALRCNPFAPEVPCHRVIASSGSVGGFWGSTEPDAMGAKIRLLAAEGIIFEKAGVVHPDHILRRIVSSDFFKGTPPATLPA